MIIRIYDMDELANLISLGLNDSRSPLKLSAFAEVCEVSIEAGDCLSIMIKERDDD